MTRRRSSLRVTESFSIGPFRIGASAGRGGLRGFLGVRTGRASTSVSFPVGRRRKNRKS
jgi:hypothetical protein